MKCFFIISLFYAFSGLTIMAQNNAQKISIDLNYPLGEVAVDNIQMKTMQPELRFGRDKPYYYYEFFEKNWEVGQLFQMTIDAEMEGYFYAFGLTSSGKIHPYYPLFNKENSVNTSPFSIPAQFQGFTLLEKGILEVCVLYSPKKIKHWQNVIKQLDILSGNLQERVDLALGIEIAQLRQSNYQKDDLTVVFDDATSIIPLFFEINGQSAEAELELEKPNLHVLCIGPQFIDLKYSTKDAQDIGKLFKSQEGKFYNEVHLTELTGKEATAANILISVEALQKQARLGNIKKSDHLVLFVSSHGFIHQDELNIVGADYNTLYPTETSVQYTKIYMYLKDIHCPKIILLDVSASPFKQPSEVIIYTEDSPIKPLPKELFYPILSNSESEFSYENAVWENSAFTKSIIEALEGKADKSGNGKISFSEFYDFVSKRTAYLVATTLSKSQTPIGPRPEYVDFDFFSVE